MNSLFMDVEYCKSELISARKMMGDRRVMNNNERREMLIKGVVTVYLNCPPEITSFALSVLQELMRRIEIMFDKDGKMPQLGGE